MKKQILTLRKSSNNVEIGKLENVKSDDPDPGEILISTFPHFPIFTLFN
jgi:hypothetical protein